MRVFLNLCCAASAAWVLSVLVFDPKSSAEGRDVSDSAREWEKMPLSAPVFGSHVRSKVVQYFDIYRSEPLGLPPGFMAAVLTEAKPNPLQLAVFAEDEPFALMGTPTEMERILPKLPDIRYYLAGSHLVAVDSAFKVVDSISIPTIRPRRQLDSRNLDAIQLVRHPR